MESIYDWEDRDIFFDPDDFGIEATLEIKHLPAMPEYPDNRVSIHGHWDTPYGQRDYGAFITDAQDPSFTCKWIDLFEYARAGDVLTIGTTDYYLESAPQSDGTGICAMILVPADTQDAVGDTAQSGINTGETRKPTGTGRGSGNLYKP